MTILRKGGSRLLPIFIASLATAMMLIAQGATPRAQSAPKRIVAFGDSLTAGYQLPAEAAFPSVLARVLKEKGLNVIVANAGVSGDTTAAGLARLDWSVPDGTDGVILELGANDALRGLDPKRAEENLDRMISRLKERGIAVLLAGMYAPRNNGADYVAAFDGMYPRLAGKHGVPLHPFFLEGVTGVPALLLPDGLHPNAKGVEKIVEGIVPAVEKWLKAQAP